MRELENYCVGCPQGCINCGRKNDVLVITCDWCGNTIDYECDYDNDEVKIIGGVNDIKGQDICDKCYSRYEEGELDEDGNEVEEKSVKADYFEKYNNSINYWEDMHGGM